MLATIRLLVDLPFYNCHPKTDHLTHCSSRIIYYVFVFRLVDGHIHFMVVSVHGHILYTSRVVILTACHCYMTPMKGRFIFTMEQVRQRGGISQQPSENLAFNKNRQLAQ